MPKRLGAAALTYHDVPGHGLLCLASLGDMLNLTVREALRQRGSPEEEEPSGRVVDPSSSQAHSSCLCSQGQPQWSGG